MIRTPPLQQFKLINKQFQLISSRNWIINSRHCRSYSTDNDVRAIAITGPSCSGKTSLAKYFAKYW